MKHALAILTYAEKDSHGYRINALLDSLRSTGYPGNVFIVDDGSPIMRAFSTADWEPAPSYVRRESRGGVSRGKNTCIRLLMGHGVDVGFLADDDIEFEGDWWTPYLEAHSSTGWHHFSWADSRKEGVTPVKSPTASFRVSRHLNGCFLTFTPEVVEKVGGFPVTEVLWGWDHVNWTQRIIKAGLSPGYVDADADHIKLNRYSTDSAVPVEERRLCRGVTFDDTTIYMPLIE